MVARHQRGILGKIAADVGAPLDARARSGGRAGTRRAVLASGIGWEAADVVCTAGPHDRVFEEQHSEAAVAVVVAGSFQYRTPRGVHMMTPGSFFLGNPGECYECGHEHAPGDRCVAFSFAPSFMDDVARAVGARRDSFGASRVPVTRGSSGVVAGIATALADERSGAISWEEVALDVAATALRASHDLRVPTSPAPADALGRVTRAVREIEIDPTAAHDLRTLAANAELSTFQFLRSFQRVTGATPHQYLLRTRLREAAASLRARDRKIVEVALECGFNDLSNFNHAFRAEFGVPPRAYRAGARSSGTRA